MTGAPRPGPAFSFRNIPPAIYVALGVGVVGSLVLAIATLLVSGERYERYQAVERWRMLDTGCDAAYAILLGLGLLELARRHVGPTRTLALAAAWTSFASLAWFGIQPLIAIFEPSGDTLQSVYDWLGRGVGATMLAGIVLLTVAADAWRRAPIAAAGLVVLGVTSYWVPVIGEEISELVGFDPTTRQLYGLARLAVHVVALLFVAAALAAGGRDPAPEPRAAATGLRLARGVLVFRIVAAIVITPILLAGRSQDAAKFVLYAGPAVMVVTMLVFAIALQRVASARVDGMPRLLFSLGAALTVWWGAIQLEQLSTLIGAMRDAYRAEHALQVMQRFAIAGPIVVTLGLALVGSAIVSFASRRGDAELRGGAASRTITFVATTLMSIGVQSRLTEAKSLEAALAMIVLAAILAIVGLAALVSLLGRAAESLEATSGVPPARVV